MKRTRRVLLTIGFSVVLPVYAQVNGTQAPAAGAPNLKDPVELCQKLGGTERDICVAQARQNRGPSGDAIVGATPGTPAAGTTLPASGGEKDKRGNTPPGSDRAGSAPAAGAIVDPAGVTKR